MSEHLGQMPFFTNANSLDTDQTSQTQRLHRQTMHTAAADQILHCLLLIQQLFDMKTSTDNTYNGLVLNLSNFRLSMVNS